MKREELKKYLAVCENDIPLEARDEAVEGCEVFSAFDAMEADSVMDALERRIKELEAENEKLKAQVPEWISVKDKLPTEYDDYLVVHKNWCDKDVIDVFSYVFDLDAGYACWVTSVALRKPQTSPIGCCYHRPQPPRIPRQLIRSNYAPIKLD